MSTKPELPLHLELFEDWKRSVRTGWKKYLVLNAVGFTFYKLGVWLQLRLSNSATSWGTPKFVRTFTQFS